MQAHQPTRIARTLAEAESLGHEETDASPSAEHLERGVHFTDAPGTPGVICWTGLCGDPEPGWRYVKYTDANGNCNIYKKVRC
jgi:hypothetical protein